MRSLTGAIRFVRGARGGDPVGVDPSGDAGVVRLRRNVGFNHQARERHRHVGQVPSRDGSPKRFERDRVLASRDHAEPIHETTRE